ncbi:MAG TPA: hypothetical protein VD905_17570 [Flavobacteriales bacterium]|nr:hypothetical protein [Flavobacteriales bacterium]
MKEPFIKQVPFDPSCEYESELMATIASTIKDNPNDLFIKRSDPLYKETEKLHRAYFGNNTSQVIKQKLVSIIIQQTEMTLIIIGVDSYLLTLPEVAAELERRNFTGKLHLVIIDPLQDELQKESAEITANKGIIGNIQVVCAKVETLNPKQWHAIHECPGKKIVFANFSLHYILPSRRMFFLKTLKQFTDGIFMVERDLNLLGQPKDTAIRLTWNHFLPLYKIIGTCNARHDEKRVLYNWFGMLVRDALNESTQVVCTHLCESIEQWKTKLKKAGFDISNDVNYLSPGEEPKPGICFFPLHQTSGSKETFLACIISNLTI